jgi:hypothetical protein
MMEWLNSNAAAVQALAAVTTVILTAVLARLTHGYVRLTKNIADSASEQVEIARLQVAVSENLANASKEQRALNQQRVDEVKHQEETSIQEGKRELDRLAARLLTQLSGSSSEPELDFLNRLEAISAQVLDSIRDAAEQAREPKVGNLESAIASLEGIADLQARVAAAPEAPYIFSASERETYKTNLRNARAELSKFTSYIPLNNRY